MADDQRTALVKAMVAEGTGDDDIRAALAVYDKQHPQQPAVPVQNRPLLTGLTDAGAAQQFNNPAAMQDLNAAKNTAANVGIGTGVAVLGGGVANTVAPGLLQGIAKGAGWAGAAKALTSMGMSPSEAALLVGFLGGGGVKRDIGGAIKNASLGNLVAKPDPTPPSPTVINGLPGSIRPISVMNYGAEGAPITVQTPTDPGFTPASKSAFINVDSPQESGRTWRSGATGADDKAQAAALHRYDMDMDNRYRAATAAERASLRTQAPLSFRDALVSLLQNGRQ